MDILGSIFGPGQPGDLPRDPNSGWTFRNQQTPAGVWVDERRALTYSAVTACVQILSRIVAQLPLGVHKRKSDGSAELDRSHTVDFLLSKESNDLMTSYMARETGQQHVVLWGNSCAEIQRDSIGSPEALLPLLPDRTFPKFDRNNRLRYKATRFDGVERDLPYEDVLHVPGLSYDGLWGYSVIGNARNAIGLGLATETFGSKFFSQGAKSGGVLQYPGQLSETMSKNITQSWDAEEGGLDNAHKVRILEEGMKWIPTTIPPEDAQFLDTRAFQVSDVSRWFGVPEVLLNAHDKTSSWGTGVEQIFIGFLITTVDSWLKRWEQEYDRKLFSPREKKKFFTKFNVEGLLRADSKSKAEFLKSLVQGSLMTPDEGRSKLDLADYDGKNGKKLILPANMGFLDNPTPPKPGSPMPTPEEAA